MILNARQNGFLLNLPQDFFNSEINEKYQPYYRNLLTPYRSLSDFMASTIQTVNFPGFHSMLKQQVSPMGKIRENQSAVPIADQFTRELKISFKLTDGWLNYLIFLDNMLNYLEPANVNPNNSEKSLGQALSNFPIDNVNHPFFSPIRLTILNNEGYTITSMIFNRPMIIGLTDFQLSYAAVRSEFKSFTATFKYYNFDLETEFS